MPAWRNTPDNQPARRAVFPRAWASCGAGPAMVHDDHVAGDRVYRTTSVPPIALIRAIGSRQPETRFLLGNRGESAMRVTGCRRGRGGTDCLNHPMSRAEDGGRERLAGGVHRATSC